MSDKRWGVLLDLDGTLVDSVFHHVLAWDAVLVERGFTVPLWQIHQAIGMGGDRLIPWLLGTSTKELGEIVDELSAAEGEAFVGYAEQLRACEGALALIDDLEARGVPHIVASSASSKVTPALLDALGRDDLDVLTGDDVDTTKPAPDPLKLASERLGVEPAKATLIGDSPWDAEAASRIGMRCLAVRCGGFGASELMAAGASAVVDDPRALIGRL